ncbi:MAG: SHOCT domain-containing protein [Proteobacteria bacterium]|nr:SHOCT domain-containing protein [Pseudomonadota bacterium]
MASAKDILDERLARGEITAEEHARLAAQISQQGAAPERGAPAPRAPAGLPGPSWLWSYGSIAVAVFVVITFASVSRGAVAECMRSGAGSFSFCQENGVNWGFIYTMYGVAALCALSGISNLVRSRK